MSNLTIHHHSNPVYPVKTAKIRPSTISVPGSKSYSHRIAIAASLASGTSEIHNMLKSEDTTHTLSALEQLGAQIQQNNQKTTITGMFQSDAAPPPATGSEPEPIPIYTGNSGTTMRLITAVAALCPGTYHLYGTERMHERPIGELLDALGQLSVKAVSVNNNNCPPVEITGPLSTGGIVDLDCSVSSQYLSALLLIAPHLKTGLEINITKGLVSKPYVEMTIDVLNRFGIEAHRKGNSYFRVPGRQNYTPGTYIVEPDCSQAGYFWAAGAITGTPVTVSDISKHSRQGDINFIRVLKDMGCKIEETDNGITVSREDIGDGAKKPLTAVTVDMQDMPDLVPTLAVVAAFARGKTVIKNVAHLAAKESDRLAAVVTELTKMGISAKRTKDGLAITGGTPKGAVIETYNDHRIAMSFALTGLVVPDVTIANPGCVEKSFPAFWDVFEGLYQT